MLFSLLSGCGLFETRNPEPPSNVGATFVPPTSPDIVLSNLILAIRERNTGNYLRCLPDTLSTDVQFRFIPTAAASGRYVSTFTSWSLASEQSYFNALTVFTDPQTTSSLELMGKFSVVAADSAIYDGSYLLTFLHSVPGVAQSVRGTLQFTLRPDRTFFWRIIRWVDNPDGDLPSWSEWKGRFAN
jgi:hypothetical protein